MADLIAAVAPFYGLWFLSKLIFLCNTSNTSSVSEFSWLKAYHSWFGFPRVTSGWILMKKLGQRSGKQVRFFAASSTQIWMSEPITDLGFSKLKYNTVAYRVAQLKWSQLTFLFIKFEWIDKIQWFLVSAITVHSHTLGSPCYISHFTYLHRPIILRFHELK